MTGIATPFPPKGSAVDITDPCLYAHGDPHAVIGALRSEHPFVMQSHRGESFVAFLRHRDVAAVYRDSRGFSSASGTLLTHHGLNANPAAGQMLALTDPPRHTQLRRLLASSFSPRAVHESQALIMQTAHDVVDRILEERTSDLVSAVSSLPLAVICAVLGVPHADWSYILGLTQQAFGGAQAAEQADAHREILSYFYESAAERRRSPAADVTTALATALVQNSPLTDAEVVANCDNLIVGGTETVRHTAAGGVLAFIDHPDQWRRLSTSAAEMAVAVEEILRWTSAPIHILRTATKAYCLGDHRINAGEVVALWIISANRDDAAFPGANVFDVKRRENPHLSLGAGRHFCIGAFFARAELTAFFTEFRRRVTMLELAGAPKRLESNAIYGFESLPISVEPA